MTSLMLRDDCFLTTGSWTRVFVLVAISLCLTMPASNLSKFVSLYRYYRTSHDLARHACKGLDFELSRSQGPRSIFGAKLDTCMPRN